MNLDDLEPAHRAALLAGAKRVRLARGQSAYSLGDRADRVFFVRSGRVKIVRTNPSGAEAIVGIRTAGDAFGELTSFVDEGVRATSAIAIEAVEADAISAAAFGAALEHD
nr:cyclic nucleotide-binding domain-containing protein [Candidatus Eremiobacteraeota bacterium]